MTVLLWSVAIGLWIVVFKLFLRQNPTPPPDYVSRVWLAQFHSRRRE